MVLIATATLGITFSIQARFAQRTSVDAPVRIVLAALALTALLHPDRQLAWLACVPLGLIVGYWILRRRNVPVLAAAVDAR